MPLRRHSCGFAELREVDAREQHPLGLEQQVVALLGVVVQDVVGVLAVGAQEEVEEPGVKRGE